MCRCVHLRHPCNCGVLRVRQHGQILQSSGFLERGLRRVCPYFIHNQTFEDSDALLAVDNPFTDVRVVELFEPLLLHPGVAPIRILQKDAFGI